MDTNGRRLPSASDRDLVVAFKSGDAKAYDEIYRRHSPKIRAVCSRRLPQRFDVDEAVQETFLRAYQALGRFNGQYKLGAWLNRIAVNVCIDEMRSRARGDIVENLDDSDLEAERGPDDIISSRRPDVIAALHELKPLHADVLRLRAWQEMSHEELATRLDMTPGQVKALLHRARLAFKRIVREASGFIAAPLALLRRHRKGDQVVASGSGGAHAMSMLASVHLALPAAERVVAGAVVAALTLGGTPAAPSGSAEFAPVSKVKQGSRQPVERRATESEKAPERSSTSPERSRSDDAGSLSLEVPVDAPDATELPERVTEHVQQELEQHSNGNEPAEVDHKEKVEKVRRDVTDRVQKVEEVAADAPGHVLDRS